MVVQDDDLKRTGLGLVQPLLRSGQLCAANSARLMAPGPNRVEADHVERGGGVRRLGGLPLPLKLDEGSGEASREPVRDVVVSGNGDDRPAESSQETGRIRELFSAPAVAQISTCNHELGLETIDQDGRSALDRLVVARAEMEVRQV